MISITVARHCVHRHRPHTPTVCTCAAGRAPRPLTPVAMAATTQQKILLPSEHHKLQMERGVRYACAPPPEQCIRPADYSDRITMQGKEQREKTEYPMPPIKGRKPHIVCLHGTACNNNILKTQLRELTKNWERKVDLSFVEGSMVITNMFHPTYRLIKEAFGEQPMHKQYVETSPIDREAKVYGMFDFALAKFDEKLMQLENTNPVDALIGFSQGGLFATLLAARNLKRKDSFVPYRCVVLLNPPNPESLGERVPDFFDEPIATPALVVKGLADDVVPGGPEMYGPMYSSVELDSHPGAHQPMPSEPEDSAVLAKKIHDFIAKHCPTTK